MELQSTNMLLKHILPLIRNLKEINYRSNVFPSDNYSTKRNIPGFQNKGICQKCAVVDF